MYWSPSQFDMIGDYPELDNDFDREDKTSGSASKKKVSYHSGGERSKAHSQKRQGEFETNFYNEGFFSDGRFYYVMKHMQNLPILDNRRILKTDTF